MSSNGHSKTKSDDNASVVSVGTTKTKSAGSKKPKEFPEIVNVKASRVFDLFEHSIDKKIVDAIEEIQSAFSKVRTAQPKNARNRYTYEIKALVKPSNFSDSTKEVLNRARAKYSQEMREEQRQKNLTEFRKTSEYKKWKAKNVEEVKAFRAYEDAFETYEADLKRNPESATPKPSAPEGYKKYLQFCERRKEYRAELNLYKENQANGILGIRPVAPFYPGEPVPNIDTAADYDNVEEKDDYTHSIEVLRNMKHKVGSDAHLQITMFASLLVRSLFEGTIAGMDRSGISKDASVKITLGSVLQYLPNNIYRNLIMCLKCYDQAVYDVANPKVTVRKPRAKKAAAAAAPAATPAAEEKTAKKPAKKGSKKEESESESESESDDESETQENPQDDIPLGGDAESHAASTEPKVKKTKVHDIYKHKSSISSIRADVFRHAKTVYPQFAGCKKVTVANDVTEFCNSVINQFIELVGSSVKEYAQRRQIRTISRDIVEIILCIITRAYNIDYSVLSTTLQNLIDQYESFMRKKNEARKKSQEHTMASVPETIPEETEEKTEAKPKKVKAKKVEKVEEPEEEPEVEEKPKSKKKKAPKKEEPKKEDSEEDD